MKTQTQFFAAHRNPNSNAQRGWDSKAALAIIIGLTLSACTSDRQESNGAAFPRVTVTSASLLTVQVASNQDDKIDNSRECNIEQTIVYA